MIKNELENSPKQNSINLLGIISELLSRQEYSIPIKDAVKRRDDIKPAKKDLMF
jgi:hypothetical protein